MNPDWQALKQVDLLAVDDHRINCEFIEAALRPLVNSLHIVRNGQQAIDACREHRFDLILMDLHMPDMDGVSAWRKIQQNLPGKKATRAIALTAENREEEQRRIQKAGFSGYLHKPVSLDDLCSALLLVQRGTTAFSVQNPPVESRCRILDHEQSIKRCGSSKRALQMQQALAEELERQFHVLDHAMHTRKFSTAIDALHQWSGACGYAGAELLRQSSQALEQRLRSDDHQGAGALYLDFVRRVESTLQALRLNVQIQS